MMFYFFLVIAVGCIAVSVGVPCTRPTAKPAISTDILPTVAPKSFTIDVESFSKPTNQIVSSRIRYDAASGIIRATHKSNGVSTDVYYLFHDNEILNFQYQKDMGSCTTINDLKNSPQTYLVGGVITDAAGKLSPGPFLNVLHFSGKDPSGQDIWPQPATAQTDIIRGKAVNTFMSCQVWKTGNSNTLYTVKLTHYFSKKDWNYPSSVIVPVGLHVEGTMNGVVIDRTYSFFNYQPTVDGTALETPPGIYCPGRKVDMPFPTLPDYIKWSREVINLESQSLTYIEEIYDTSDKFTLTRTSLPSSLSDMNRLVRLSDYRSGLLYTLDVKAKSCIVSNITSSKNPHPETGTVVNGRVTMDGKASYYEMVNANPVYLGKRSIRALAADTWVADASDPNVGNFTVEWYFAPIDLVDWNDQLPTGFRIPLKVRVWVKQFAAPGVMPVAGPFPMTYRRLSVDMNIYHVSTNLILFNKMSLRACSPDTPSNYFELLFKGAVQYLGNANMEKFKWDILKNISSQANVLWSRITDFKTTVKGNDVSVVFEITDMPPFAGDIANPAPQSNLQQATQRIQDGVNSGKVFVVVAGTSGGNTNTKKLLFPDTRVSIHPRTLDSGSHGSSGYTAGSMAGLGIPMLLVGLLVGGGGSYYFIFKRGTFG